MLRWSMASVVLWGASLAGCSNGSDDTDTGASDATESAAEAAPDAPAEPASAPVPSSEWEVVSPEDRGMDPAMLEEARDYAMAEERNTQGVVVVHDGAIVAEWYDDGADAESWAASWSMAKSFTSALIGIAIEEGTIPGVEEPMTTYYPDWEGTDAEDITLRDVLQMSSGLDWTETYNPADVAESDIIALVLNEDDHLAYAAGRPAAEEPGTVWNYSSGDTMLLSGVLEQATGMTADEYAAEKIFEPIGMEQVEWWRDVEGQTLTYCCLDTTSRDFARFGLLYERDGMWGDEQVVPASWVEESVEPAPASDGYAYQWWLYDVEGAPDDLYAASGFDGQWIYVMPSLDLVVVRNGTYGKDPGDPVADPSLFAKYPPQGLVPDRGTVGPESWDHAEFLGPIIESLDGT
ncbi:hypothetical protein BH23ACT2_BH23ACT2_20390 [soil metagenome]